MSGQRDITLRAVSAGSANVVLRPLPVADASSTDIVLRALHATPATIILRAPGESQSGAVAVSAEAALTDDDDGLEVSAEVVVTAQVALLDETDTVSIAVETLEILSEPENGSGGSAGKKSKPRERTYRYFTPASYFDAAENAASVPAATKNEKPAPQELAQKEAADSAQEQRQISVSASGKTAILLSSNGVSEAGIASLPFPAEEMDIVFVMSAILADELQ